MFSFNYTFAAGPPQWKDLPCFIQKALRAFVTESPVVYDRNFFLKKFGIIVKSPIVPYKTQRFKDEIITLSLVYAKRERLRHFGPERRSFLKKNLPLYASLREKIEKNIQKTEVKLPVQKVIPPSDERLIALSYVSGPTFITSTAYRSKTRDVNAFLSYHAQKILSFDRILQKATWKITKQDRRDMVERMVKLWSTGKMPMYQELEEIIDIHNETAQTVSGLKKKLDNADSVYGIFADVLEFKIDLPQLGLTKRMYKQNWRKVVDKLYQMKTKLSEIINTRDQVNANILVCRQIRANESLLSLIPKLTGLARRYKPLDIGIYASYKYGLDLHLQNIEPDIENDPRYLEFEKYMMFNPSALASCERYVQKYYS